MKPKVSLLPKSWVCLLVGVQQKTHPSQRCGEERIYLQQVRRTQGSFPKQCHSEQQNWGTFKLRVHAYSEGAWEENSARNLGKGSQSPSFSWLKSGGSTSSFHPPLGGLRSCRTQRHVSDFYVYPWGGTRTLFYPWPMVTWSFSFVLTFPYFG